MGAEPDAPLRQAAEALNCILVYALVPNSTLEEAVRMRARTIALRDLGRVAHAMKLEGQGTTDALIWKRRSTPILATRCASAISGTSRDGPLPRARGRDALDARGARGLAAS